MLHLLNVQQQVTAPQATAAPPEFSYVTGLPTYLYYVPELDMYHVTGYVELKSASARRLNISLSNTDVYELVLVGTL